MVPPPTFRSYEDYRSRLDDVDFWWPYLAGILEGHGSTDAASAPVAGFNPTYPTFLYGDVAIKLFGFVRGWRESYAAERAAEALVTTDPEIAVPRLLHAGQTSEGADAPWPYLISTRMPGIAWEGADLPDEQRRTIASELGGQVRRIHALKPEGIAIDADWPPLDMTAAAGRSSLPPHLVAQVENYLIGLEPFDRVFVHGDIVGMHTFIADGHLAGIIDWGGATVTDRHYEIIQPHRDMFDCDKSLLRAFLEAADWPVGKDFARKAMGHALRRQATMFSVGDVFMPIAEKFPLNDIATLEDLASELFEI